MFQILKGIRLKRTTILALFFFGWFILASNYPFAQSNQPPADKLSQGKAKYELGDYETSIRLLEEYIADQTTTTEKRAEAYYFLAKNYFAVNPEKVGELLRLSFDSNWFFSIEESDSYFKKVYDDARKDYLSKMAVDKFVEDAENAFEKGDYTRAKYLYRVISQKLPNRAFEKQIKNCDETLSLRQTALEHFKESRFEKAYQLLVNLNKLSPGDEEVKAAVTQIESKKIFPQLEAAQNFIDKKNYEEALSCYDAVLKYTPDNQEVLKKKSDCKDLLEKEKTSQKTIAKQGSKEQGKKKKFPWVPVVLGVVAIGVILALLLKKKSPKTGTINVSSTPTGAKILLDNNDTGNTTNAILSNISPGQHSVKLTLDGYYTYETTVNVVAGKESKVSSTLTKVPTFIVNNNNITIPEGGQIQISVYLSDKPPSDLTAKIVPKDGSDINTIYLPENGLLTFTPDNYSTPQSVTFKSAIDSDYISDETTFRLYSTNLSGIPEVEIKVTQQDTTNLGVLTVLGRNFESSGRVGGPFTPENIKYTLQNTGGGNIRWSLTKEVNWLNLSGTSGELAPNAICEVTVTINELAKYLTVNTYSDSLKFINLTNGKGSQSYSVTLLVSAVPRYTLNVTQGEGVEGAPSSGVYNYNEGSIVSYAYSLKPNYVDLKVTLDGAEVSPNGDITMDSSHTLIASATALDSPPVVALTSPADNSIVYDTITVEASATDDKAVTRVEFFINNALATTVTSSPYRFQWNTRNVVDGTYTIKAIAYDVKQNTESLPITVTVRNNGIIVTPITGFSPSGPAGGSFSPASVAYTIYNPSTSSLNWSVSANEPWLTFLTPISGTLTSGSSASVTVSINSNAESLAAGVYTDTISFYNLTNTQGNTSRAVTLTIY